MEYCEFPLPGALHHWVRAVWTLEGDGAANAWLDHEAMPDGCMEIILRLRGRSQWGAPQPALFVAGLATRPATLRLSGDIRCLGVRLWPWSWAVLGGRPCRSLADCWTGDIPPGWRDGLPRTPEDAIAHALRLFCGAALPGFVPHLPQSASVGELCAHAGLSHRTLQRWFARHVGVTPGHYLRLLRFQSSLARIQRDDQPLAAHAAESGFADQAHMARDFRELGGVAPVVVRKKAIGPFV